MISCGSTTTNFVAAGGLPGRSAQAALAPASGESGGSRNPARILVVEDDYFVALELEHRLMQAGYDVIGVAGTAAEALRLAIAQKPELAIMDIRLGGRRDGIEAAIELRAKFAVPSIFATAHGDPETRARAAQAHPLGWLEKPYGPETLLNLVESALSRLRAGQ